MILDYNLNKSIAYPPTLQILWKSEWYTFKDYNTFPCISCLCECGYEESKKAFQFILEQKTTLKYSQNSYSLGFIYNMGFQFSLPEQNWDWFSFSFFNVVIFHFVLKVIHNFKWNIFCKRSFWWFWFYVQFW